MSSLNYTIRRDDGKEGSPTFELNETTEYLIAYYLSTVNSDPSIQIWGNPKGLRRLGQALIDLADVDQNEIGGPGNYLDHDRFDTGQNSEAYDSLPSITIGRADLTNDCHKLEETFPPFIPEFGDSAII